MSAQEATLRKECAENLAHKVVSLTYPDTGKLGKFVAQIAANNALLFGMKQHLQDPVFIDECNTSKTEKANPTAVGPIPKVMKLDQDGNPINSDEPCETPETPGTPANKAEFGPTSQQQLEEIDLSNWPALQKEGRLQSRARALVHSSVCLMKGQQRQPCVVVLRIGSGRNGHLRATKKSIMVKASEDIPIGQLQIPLGMMHMSSLVSCSSTKHPHAVSVEVSWPVSEQEKAAGIEEEHITMEMRANPELALPSKPSDDTKPLQWSPQHCADYFWLIRRQGTEDNEWNCEIHMRALTQVCCVQ